MGRIHHSLTKNLLKVVREKPFDRKERPFCLYLTDALNSIKILLIKQSIACLTTYANSYKLMFGRDGRVKRKRYSN